MGLNVSTQMSFENKDALKNAAREIFKRSNASKETTEKIVEKPVEKTVEKIITKYDFTFCDKNNIFI